MDAQEQSHDEAVEAAVQIVSQHENGVVDTVTLKNGIVLKLSPVSMQMAFAASSQISRPEVPKVLIADRGVEEENPDDPDYKQALEEWNTRLYKTMVNVYLLLGTSVEYVPDGMLMPDSDNWVEMIERMRDGLHIDVSSENRHERYLAWLTYYALPRPQDLRELADKIAAFSNVTEPEVQAAVDSFRSGEVGGANTDIPSEESRDRDNNQADIPIPGTRTRRARSS